MNSQIILAALLAIFVGASAAQSGETGTFTDGRDGKTYKTVKIGNQTWTAENLNYQPQQGNSWCYKDSLSYCGKYGRLYDWKTAKTVCPSGWHLPSRQEWDDFVATLGGFSVAGKKLKTKSGWVDGNGTDDYGFSALPGGYRYTSGTFHHAGNQGYWWTDTEYGLHGAYSKDIYYNRDIISENNNYKIYANSVRCVAD